MSINTMNTNPNAFYEAQWCPNIGDRNKRERIAVEIIGTLGKGVQQPVQNLKVSLSGTEIKTTDTRDYDIGQEIFFLKRWWQIKDVLIDISEYAPQSAMYVGDELNNASYSLEIVSTGRTGQ